MAIIQSNDIKLDLSLTYPRNHGINNRLSDLPYSVVCSGKDIFGFIQGSDDAAATTFSNHKERIPFYDGLYSQTQDLSR